MRKKYVKGVCVFKYFMDNILNFEKFCYLLSKIKELVIEKDVKNKIKIKCYYIII